MPIQFKLPEAINGYAMNFAGPGEAVDVCYRELIGPDASHLNRQLGNLHDTIFAHIPGLPDPSVIDHILVVIEPTLDCTAYVNELRIVARVKSTRSVVAGDPVYVRDIVDIATVDLGVTIPDDCGLVLVRSTGWRRSLFFDLGPLSPDIGARNYKLDQALAQQALLLLGLVPDSAETSARPWSTRLELMAAGLEQLRALLAGGERSEAAYQTVLEEHPWMLGVSYSEFKRHARLDDENIPDFTATRCYDGCHDIVELKHPFLRLFRDDQGFASDFNDAWNQAERYLAFTIQERAYLRDRKKLRFENPRCVLLMGYKLNEIEMGEIRNKQGFNRAIHLLTYDQLVETASYVLGLVRTAQDRIAVEATEKAG